MKDFAGNEINEAALTRAIASIDWSRTPTIALPPAVVVSEPPN